MADAKVGQVGLVIRITVKDELGVAVDISSATTFDIVLRNPAGSLVTLTGSFTTDGTNGQVEAPTISSTFDNPGQYRVAAHIITATEDYYTDFVPLKVVRVL